MIPQTGCLPQAQKVLDRRTAAPIYEGPLAQGRCFILGCWLRGDSCSGASAPWAEGSGSGQSPAGWSSKRVRMGQPPGCPPGARHHPQPGVARMSPAYCYGIATVLLRCCYGVSPMLMPSTWEIHRGDTVEIPCLHRAGWLGGRLGAARGFSILRKALATAPLAGNRPGFLILTTVSLAQQAGAGQPRVDRGRGSKRSYSRLQA